MKLSTPTHGHFRHREPLTHIALTYYNLYIPGLPTSRCNTLNWPNPTLALKWNNRSKFYFTYVSHTNKRRSEDNNEIFIKLVEIYHN